MATLPMIVPTTTRVPPVSRTWRPVRKDSFPRQTDPLLVYPRSRRKARQVGVCGTVEIESEWTTRERGWQLSEWMLSTSPIPKSEGPGIPST